MKKANAFPALFCARDALTALRVCLASSIETQNARVYYNTKDCNALFRVQWSVEADGSSILADTQRAVEKNGFAASQAPNGLFADFGCAQWARLLESAQSTRAPETTFWHPNGAWLETQALVYQNLRRPKPRPANDYRLLRCALLGMELCKSAQAFQTRVRALATQNARLSRARESDAAAFFFLAWQMYVNWGVGAPYPFEASNVERVV